MENYVYGIYLYIYVLCLAVMFNGKLNTSHLNNKSLACLTGLGGSHTGTLTHTH